MRLTLTTKSGLVLVVPLLGSLIGVGVFASFLEKTSADLSKTLAVISVFAFLTFVAGIVFTRRYIVRPILQFEAVARRLREGDFSQKLDISTGDELSALAKTFNAMTEDVERLIEAQNLLRQAVNASSDAIFITDREGLITFVNTGFTRLYGFSPTEVVGKTTPRILRSDAMSADAAATLWRALLSGDGVTREHVNKTKDGRLLTVESSANAVLNGKGEVTCFLAIQRDVTERTRAEAAARQSTERRETVIRTAMDAFWLVDAQGGLLEVNEAYCRMSGYSERELVGMRVPDLEANETASDTAAHMLDIVRLGRSRFESRHRRKDGSTFDVEISVQSQSLDRGQFVVFLRDLTERNRLHSSLAQSDRLASVGMLAAGVAHEINNPLAYVLSNIDILARDLPNLVGVTMRCCAALRGQVGEAAFAEMAGDGAGLVNPVTLADLVDCAQGALEGTRRIKTIARGLATFSRVEQSDMTSVDVNRVIESAATMANNEVKYRARYVKDLGPVPAILASEGKLAQVFLNLIINAAHAIGDGHVDSNRITIRTWADGDDVFAEVADTGQGIPPENLERIFEPFFTTKKLGAGTGLGLAISKNIVTETGGDIRVESEVGKGTRFTIRLPANSAKPGSQPDAAVSTTPPAPTVRGRILVVDDEEQIRKVLQRILGHQHEVVAVASGSEGQAVLEKDQAFDLILCDLMMPELTGMDLHAWLAARAPALARQVVFVTGGAFTPGASDYLASVGNLQVEKPFDQANLTRLCSELIVAARSKRGDQGG